MGLVKKYIYETTKYGFSSGQIRALEKHLLTKHIIERLLDAKNLKLKLHVLDETSYSHLFDDINTVDELEKACEFALKELYDFIAEISENPYIVDFFKLKYDYHNLKIILKKQLLGNDNSEAFIKLGRYSPRLIEKSIKGNNFKILDKEIYKTIDSVKEVFQKTNDSVLVDTATERCFFGHLLHLAKKIKSSHLVLLVRTMIDLANVRVVFRNIEFKKAKEISEDYLIKGGFIAINDIYAVSNNREQFFAFLAKSNYGLLVEKLQRNVSIEKLFDDFILDLNDDLKYEIAGIDVLAGYLMAREYEIKTIRLILVSALRNIPTEQVRERVLSIYG